jgi:HEAT repeat protein
MKKGLLLSVLVLIVCFVSSAVADEVDVLIKQLRKGNVSQRLAAAKGLNEKKDPRAVTPLVAALRKDANWDVRLAAEEALISIGSSSVKPLLQILQEDKEGFARRRAARALGDLKETCDPRQLKNLAQKDKDSFVRRCAARALGEVGGPEAAEFLDEAMKKKNLEVIKAAYAYYIRKGEPGTEDSLIEALGVDCWDKDMIFDFAHSGNEKLKQAADEIVKKRAYEAPSEWSGPKWGKV